MNRLSVVLLSTWVLFSAHSAWSQSEVERLAVMACNEAVNQMYSWCGRQQQGGNLARQNCGDSRNKVQQYCYSRELPQLACASAQKESELFCNGNSWLPGPFVGEFCGDAQNKINSICFNR